MLSAAMDASKFFSLILIFCSLWLTCQASHKIFPEFQSVSDDKMVVLKQYHRTGYHFQPPHNWINGNFFVLSLSIFGLCIIRSFLIYSYISNHGVCFCHCLKHICIAIFSLSLSCHSHIPEGSMKHIFQYLLL
jgi:hypothetical protein